MLSDGHKVVVRETLGGLRGDHVKFVLQPRAKIIRG